MRKSLGVAVPLVLFVAWFAWLGPRFLGGPASYIFVSGISMEPGMHTGDLAILREQDEYRVGDVVAYDPGVGAIIHRIVGGDAREGFVLLGDNKDEVDPWLVTPDQVLGRMEYHIPGAATRMALLREPRAFGLLVGLAAGLTLVPGGPAHRRRRKGGRQVQPRDMRASKGGAGEAPGLSGGALGPLQHAPLGLVAGFVLVSALALSAGLATLIAFRESSTSTTEVTTLAYTQSLAFDYTFEVEPSSIYPGGTVRPARPEAPSTGALAGPPPGAVITQVPGAGAREGAAASTVPAIEPEQPVYAKLARALLLDVTYRLDATLSASTQGVLTADLEVGPAGGWTRSQPLIAPVEFTGTEAHARVRVDLPVAYALVRQVDGELGIDSKQFELRVVPRVTLDGALGAHPVEERFGEPFVVKMTAEQITPDGVLEHRVPSERHEQVTAQRLVSLLGRTATVNEARAFGLAVTLGAGSVAGVLAASIYLGLGRSEEAKIRARYGSMLLRVTEASDAHPRDRIRVSTMRDLSRLAQRDGGLILDEATGPYGRRYFVVDGDTVYEYVPEPPSRHRFSSLSRADSAAPRPPEAGDW